MQLKPHTKPWEDIVYGSIVYDVASIEGDPVSLTYLFSTHVYFLFVYNINWGLHKINMKQMDNLSCIA